MSEAGGAAADAFDDALVAAQLLAVDPIGLGGMMVRGWDGARDQVLATLRDALPPGAPWRRLPVGAGDEQLLGGLDLGATLGRGAVVWRAGLLAAADGGVVIVPMAERLPDTVAARIAAVLDTQEIVIERDGVGARLPARFALVLIADDIEPDERPPASLVERLAFHLDLGRVRPGARPLPVAAQDPSAVAAPADSVIEAFAATAAAFGIDTVRAPLFALRAARAAAAIAGRCAIAQEDVVLAARLVLAPRATQVPAEEAAAPPGAPEPPAEGEGADQQPEGAALDDLVIAAVRAALPADLLARMAGAGARRAVTGRVRGAGERRRSAHGGRPLGARAGMPGGGARLSLIDTLRAAAPWQKLRRAAGDDPVRIRIRRDDLRIRRFETRAEATTIFAVDASGSSALARLAEAKGAVELLLSEAYVKRAQVALIAFRGQGADVLLPATRSLSRARRALAELPGGGGTPLAAGLDAAREVAAAARSRGRTPFVVVLTDGRSNVAADGSTVRGKAEEDAHVAARAIRTAGIASAFIDTSARPRPEGARLAAAMGARYLPLPKGGAEQMHAAVKAAQPPVSRR